MKKIYKKKNKMQYYFASARVKSRDSFLETWELHPDKYGQWMQFQDAMENDSPHVKNTAIFIHMLPSDY